MTAPVNGASAVRPKNRVAAAAAAIAATGAVACGVCCVLPFALPAAVLALSGGVLAWFAGIMPWITMVALVTVAGAWTWVGAQSARTKRRPAASTLLIMGMATAMLALALAWPHIEGPIIALVRR